MTHVAFASAEQLKKITPEIVAKLREPLPSDAIKQHPTKPYLSTIKVIYIVERLNDVFGLAGWHVRNEIIESGDKMVVVKATLTVPEFGIEVEQFGGNDNPDRGDAYKGACTDALSKIGSYLYVGMDVYKGMADATRQAEQPKNSVPAKQPINPPARPTQTTRPPQSGKRVISDNQAKRFYAMSKGGNRNDDEVKAALARYGFTSSREITTDVYDDLCKWASAGRVA